MEYQSVFLGLGLALFLIGTAGALVRRTAIVVFLCIEIMLGGVNLVFLTFARSTQSAEGVFMVMCIMAVAAVEAAVGLAIFFRMYQKTGSIDVERFNLLKW